MRFSLTFFPTVRPSVTPAEAYYQEALDLAAEAERIGFDRVRCVEHYFHPYGGYAPDPVVLLTAIAARTTRIRLCTSAVLPAFTHPIHLAAKLAMLDCLSGGRLDVGFARAFLPDEFDAFQVPLDESRPRFEEGIAACIRLWTEENVRHEGRFHQFGPLTLLPRPVQRPHPPVWIAAVTTPESFVWAGEQGFGLMVVPYLSDFDRLAENLRLYRAAFRASGKPGTPRVQLSFHLYLADDRRSAEAEARDYLNEYLDLFHESAAAWTGRASAQYAGYETLARQLHTITYDRVLAESRAWIGDPDRVIEMARAMRDRFGPIEPSLIANFAGIPKERAWRSLRLFAEVRRALIQDPATPE